MLEPPLDMDELLEHSRPDKKSRGGALRWVLLSELGAVAVAENGGVTHEIPAEMCREPLNEALRIAFEAADSTA
jgi:3-dehydroquinate synthetase